jgi:hypothetical protein
MPVLLTTHSIVRWLATLVGLVLVIRLVIGLVRKKSLDRSAAALTSSFSGLMDTQLLLGVLFFILDGLGHTGFPLYRWEHAGTMLLAVIVAHLPGMWKTDDRAIGTRNTLIAVLVSMLLVFFGIGPLGGWVRWWHISGLF